MKQKDNFVDISSEMIRVMESDEHKKMFGSARLQKIAQLENPVALNTSVEETEQTLKSIVENATTDGAAKEAAGQVLAGTLPEGSINVLLPYFARKVSNELELSNLLTDYINSKAVSAPAPIPAPTTASIIRFLVKI
ncbi:MAG TPA: hypothetical protein VMX17_16870, partial [Candidatus Glassbacteria bacterium]|nr:hypothetical protein [Candidatus Glassbacteria bacterium]